MPRIADLGAKLAAAQWGLQRRAPALERWRRELAALEAELDRLHKAQVHFGPRIAKPG